MENITRIKQVLRAVSREAGWDILEALSKGSIRFTRLEGMANVSPRTLSERLKELAALGLIDRKAYAEVPPRVEYSLTGEGERVLVALQRLESPN